jgi:hypothetical protein
MFRKRGGRWLWSVNVIGLLAVLSMGFWLIPGILAQETGAPSSAGVEATGSDTDTNCSQPGGECPPCMETPCSCGQCPHVEIREILARPNDWENHLALNDELIRQNGDVGVLENWQVKYVGRVSDAAPGDVYTWVYEIHDAKKPPDQWEPIPDVVPALAAIEDDVVQGDYDVRLRLTRDARNYYSFSRRVMVASLEQDASHPLALTNGGNYTADPHNRHAVNSPDIGISWRGNLVWKGQPHPNNIRQGFIQGVRGNIDCNFPGAIVAHEKTLSPMSVMYCPRQFWQAHFSDVNDSTENHYLYGPSEATAIGEMANENTCRDTPRSRSETWRENFTDMSGRVTVAYAVDRTMFSAYFTIWLVAQIDTADPARPQFVPFTQHNWRLEINTVTSNGPWHCTALGGAVKVNTRPTSPVNAEGLRNDSAQYTRAPLGRDPDVEYREP